MLVFRKKEKNGLLKHTDDHGHSLIIFKKMETFEREIYETVGEKNFEKKSTMWPEKNHWQHGEELLQRLRACSTRQSA